MKHTLTITIDVPEGMEAAVSDAAYHTDEEMWALSRKETGELTRAALLLHNATLQDRPAEVQAVIDSLNEQKRRNIAAYRIVAEVISEMSFAMREADRARRKAQAQVGEAVA
jgi:hypothetical protein